MSLYKSINTTFSSVLMETGKSGGRVVPSRAQYSSRSKSGSLNNLVKTLSLKFVFIFIHIYGLDMRGALSKLKFSEKYFAAAPHTGHA